MSLADLVEHYEFCLLHIRSKEIELDVTTLGSIPFHDTSAVLTTRSCVLSSHPYKNNISTTNEIEDLMSHD
jgi:hypothetical protein